MLNPFVIKKYAALLLNNFIPVTMFIIGNIYYGFYGGLIFLIPGILLSVVIGRVLLNSPFRRMEEGQGILTLPIDSAGLIQPFIMKVALPSIHGKHGNKEINDVFNRETVFNIAPPIEAEGEAKIIEEENGEEYFTIKIKKEAFNKARFQFNQYPTFLYNQNLNSVLTKEMLSELENKAFAEHTILNLNRKVQELGRWIRDFARYAIEQMRPKAPMDMKKVGIWILVIIMIGMGIIFLPKLLAVLQGGAGAGAASAVKNAGNTINIVRT